MKTRKGSVLAQSFDVNAMDPAVAWLERYLAEFAEIVVAVTHDRYFLDNVAKWILVISKTGSANFGHQVKVEWQCPCGGNP